MKHQLLPFLPGPGVADPKRVAGSYLPIVIITPDAGSIEVVGVRAVARNAQIGRRNYKQLRETGNVIFAMEFRFRNNLDGTILQFGEPKLYSSKQCLQAFATKASSSSK